MLNHVSDPFVRSALDIRRIASPVRGVSEKRWCTPDLGFDIYSFAIDPSQDLLVATERTVHPVIEAATGVHRPRYYLKIHFLSLATGEPHPFSTCPVIISPVRELANSAGALGAPLTIGFRHVGIMMEDMGRQWCEFWVVQWDTAVVKIHSLHRAYSSREVDPNPPARCLPASLNLPDPAYLVVSLVHERQGRPAELGIIPLKETAQEGTVDELLCVTFELPQLKPSCSYGFIRDITTQYPSSYNDQHNDESGYFYHAETSRILAFELGLYTQEFDVITWELLTTAQVFRRYYELYCLGTDGHIDEFDCDINVAGHKWTVPWKAWEKSTRLILYYDSEHGIPEVMKLSHNRVLAIERVLEEHNEGPPTNVWQRSHRIVLYDFSPALALRRDMHASLSKEQDRADVDVEYHLDPEHVGDDEIWKEPIAPGLPYRRITTKRLPVYHGASPRLAICNNGFALLNRSSMWEVNLI